MKRMSLLLVIVMFSIASCLELTTANSLISGIQDMANNKQAKEESDVEEQQMLYHVVNVYLSGLTEYKNQKYGLYFTGAKRAQYDPRTAVVPRESHNQFSLLYEKDNQGVLRLDLPDELLTKEGMQKFRSILPRAQWDISSQILSGQAFSNTQYYQDVGGVTIR